MVPEYAQPWDKEIERRVVRKIDLALLPLMWVGYGLVYYDKVRQLFSLLITGLTDALLSAYRQFLEGPLCLE